MMWWYGSPMASWGALFMTVNTVLFWGLIILGVIALFRYLNRGDRSTVARSTPEQVLAERFARGEIDGAGIPPASGDPPGHIPARCQTLATKEHSVRS